jgi:hypothetical protein
MGLLRFSIFAGAFALAALSPLGAFAQAVPAGTITLLNGQAQVTGTSTSPHALAKGDTVYGGDVVETGHSSYALIKFTDQGSVLLRPDTKFQLEKYQYAAGAAAAAAAAPAQPAPLQAADTSSASDSNFFRLLRGSLRAVSGLVAHADYSHYEMHSPVATMGIRGTDFVVALCEGSCLDPGALEGVPAGVNLQGSVVSGVNQGQIVVTSFTGHTMTLTAGQYCVTLADGTQYLLGAAPAFLTTDAAAVVESGVAAGSAFAASSTASGSLLVDVGAAALAAVLIGVVISTSDNGNSTASTTTTAGAAAH